MAKKRKNGQGTVRLRKDGRWEGRHIVGYDENGKPKTKSVLAKNKAERIEKLKKHRHCPYEKGVRTLFCSRPRIDLLRPR